MTTENRQTRVRAYVALLFIVLIASWAFEVVELLRDQHKFEQARSGIISREDLQWHPSKIGCPDDKWDGQHGYTLVRIEGANGQEWCMPQH